MRKVTQQILNAFIKGESKAVNNTSTDGSRVWLFGNKIAYKDSQGRIFLNNCGYKTNTTKERLNAIIDHYAEDGILSRIYQRNREWYWKDDIPFPLDAWVEL